MEKVDGLWELADVLLDKKTKSRGTVQATVTRIDNEGTVWVHIPGGVDETPINGTNAASVQPGDVVGITIGGNTASIVGNYSAPAVSVRDVTNIVSPIKKAAEDAKRQADVAQKIASEIEAVSTDTNNHFWDDEYGAHVTDVEKDEFNQAIANNFSDYDEDEKPYRNILIGRLGILLRSCLNTLVGITRSAITFFDGKGDGPENIVAHFGENGMRVGYQNSSGVDISSQRTAFCDVDGVPVGVISQGDIVDKTIERSLGDDNYLWRITRDDQQGLLGIKAIPDTPNFDKGPVLVSLGRLTYTYGGNFVAMPGSFSFNALGETQTLKLSNSAFYPQQSWIGTLYCTLGKDTQGDGILIRMWSDVDSISELTMLRPYIRWTGSGASSTYRFGIGESTGNYAFSAGNSKASGDYSFSAGLGTSATAESQAVFGRYNKPIEDEQGAESVVFVVGSGRDDSTRDNALEIYSNEYYASMVKMHNLNVEGDANIYNLESSVAHFSENVRLGRFKNYNVPFVIGAQSGTPTNDPLTIGWDGRIATRGSINFQTDAPSDTAPSSAFWGPTVGWMASDNTHMAFLQPAKTTSGVTYLLIGARNKNSSGTQQTHSFNIAIDQNGNHSVSLDQTAWLKALGLTTTTDNTVANYATAASNVNITAAQYCQYGKVAMVRLAVTTTVARSGNWNVLTVKAGRRPAQMAGGEVWAYNGAGTVNLATNGVLQINGTFAANNPIIILLTYVLA